MHVLLECPLFSVNKVTHVKVYRITKVYQRSRRGKQKFFCNRNLKASKLNEVQEAIELNQKNTLLASITLVEQGN